MSGARTVMGRSCVAQRARVGGGVDRVDLYVWVLPAARPVSVYVTVVGRRAGHLIDLHAVAVHTVGERAGEVVG